MANPFSVAAVSVFPFGPAGSTTDRITALASNTTLGLGSVGTANLQYYDDIIAPLQFATGAGATGTGTVNFYLVVSEDGTLWSGGCNPTSASDQSAFVANLTPLSSPNSLINLASSTIYYFPGFSISSQLGYMPTFWSILVQNITGGALNATVANFSMKHSLVSYV